MKKPIIVPWDYTEKAEASFLHAKMLSSITSAPISLLHIVKRESEIEEALEKLENESERLNQDYSIKPSVNCRAGNLFKTISQYINEAKASIVVMPLHNSRRAIKVITRSEIPFYLVRDFPHSDKIEEMIIPIDHHEENRVQLNWVVFLSKLFSSGINIIYPTIKSKSRSKLMNNNIFFAKQILDSKNIPFDLKKADKNVRFSQSINQYTQDLKGDLIFMMSYSLIDYMKVADKVKTNVPILCINPKSIKIVPDRY